MNVITGNFLDLKFRARLANEMRSEVKNVRIMHDSALDPWGVKVSFDEGTCELGAKAFDRFLVWMTGQSKN